jgi:hypothetical protein
MRPEVAARREAEAADQAGAEVRDDVAVEVGTDEHVVLLGPLDELHREVVHDAVFELHVAVFLGDLARDAQEEAVRELHDVRLVDRGHLAAAVLAGIVEGELDDAPRSRDRDGLHRDPRVEPETGVAVVLDPVDQVARVRAPLLELDPGVEVFRVLAHDDEVDILVSRAHAPVALARSYLAVEVERFS